MTLDSILKLSIGDLFDLAATSKRTGQPQVALDLYKTWIVCHADDPALYAAYFNYATALSEAGDQAGASLAFRESVRLRPDFPQSRLSLGLVLEKMGLAGQAVLQWMSVSAELSAVTGEALEHKVMALENAGRLLESLEQDGPAEDALRQRLELARDDKVIQHYIALRMRQCKWPILDGGSRVSRRDLLRNISPLSLAALADDPLLELANAYRYNRTLVGAPAFARFVGSHTPRPRERAQLRVGYVSSDFREHAVGFAMTEVVELHDRSRVEVFGYYCGIERDDPTKQRIRNAVDRWQSLNGLSDVAAAALIRADEIDILVDLNGYTKDARTGMFALRPAPINVNWFGFPATMGSSYHHYILADAQIIPEAHEPFFSERVLRLPCYQPNDRKRVVATAATRTSEQLPEDAVVLCCLNGLQKLTDVMFARWLAILARAPNSVLWLLGGTPDTQQRLRDRAEAAGIAARRLIFAGKKTNPEHVARYALADLFLDSGPYGAHTTAADALWMSVPVLTRPGRSFASRVCSSLVQAAGLPQLVCATYDVYVERAVALANEPGELAAMRAQLRANRDTCLLFDTPQLVRHLEQAYLTMWEAFVAGDLPVPDLSDLDLLNQLGLSDEIVDATRELDDAAYCAHYAQALAATNVFPSTVIDRLRGLSRASSGIVTSGS